MFSGDVTVSDAISFIQSFHCYIRRCRTFENRTQFNSVEEHLKHFILQLLFFCLEKLIKYLRMFSGVVICWEIAAEKFTSINPSVSFYSACQHLKLLGK